MSKFQFNFKTEQYVNKPEKNNIIYEVITNLNSIKSVYEQMTEITSSFEDNIMELINKTRNEGSVSCITAETFDAHLSEFINRLIICLNTLMVTKFGYNTEVIKHWKNNEKTFKYSATIQTSINMQPIEQLICEIDNIGIYNYVYSSGSNECLPTITNDIRHNGYNNNESVIIKFGKHMSYELKNSDALNIINKSEQKFSELMEKYITLILGNFHDQINKNNDIVRSSLSYMDHLNSLF